jgi:hypothetical protein
MVGVVNVDCDFLLKLGSKSLSALNRYYWTIRIFNVKSIRFNHFLEFFCCENHLDSREGRFLNPISFLDSFHSHGGK